MHISEVTGKTVVRWLGVIGILGTVGTATGQEGRIPNDPFFREQVSFHNPEAQNTVLVSSCSGRRDSIRYDPAVAPSIAQAWAITTGSRDVVVGVIDDGFCYSHEDIARNIWENPGESGFDSEGRPKNCNRIDDDGNGYVDDVMGWDFVFGDPDPDCYAFDGKDVNRIATYAHSVPALGIIGAVGNNGVGIAGINWQVSMMLLKIAAQGNTGETRVARAAEAIRYATDNGARVINWSGYVQEKDAVAIAPLQSAVDYAESKGVLLVVGCGNSKQNIDLPENSFYPACFANENIISVGEVDFDGTLYVVPEGSRFVGGSNYGLKNVDICALAQNFSTSIYENVSRYRTAGGTSNSGPVVAGVAALMLSVRPDLRGSEVTQILMETARPLPDLQGKIKSGGIVDAYAAVLAARDYRRPATDDD